MCVGAMLIMKVKRVVTGINSDKSGGLEILPHLPLFYQKERFTLAITNRILVRESREVFLRGKPTKEHIDQYDFTLDMV
jgi:tRNA(Arg) A34 adenosine deaminase TadA